MKLILNTKDFKTALNKVLTIIGQEEMKISNYIKLTAKKDQLNIQANNTDGAISTTLKAEVNSEGNITISAKLINMLISKLDTNTITLESTKNSLKLNSEGIKANINIVEDHFIEYPLPNNTQTIKINSAELSKALNNCIPFCNDKAINGLQGINIKIEKDKIKTIGFSSNLGTIHEQTSENEQDNNITILISKKCANILSELSRTSEEEKITLELKDNLIFFKDTQTLFTGRLLDAKYPQVEKIFQLKNSNKKTIDKQKMSKALERINCFIPADTKTPVIFETENNTLTMSIKTELGENIEKINFEGIPENKIIALNCDYVLKILKKANNNNIDFYIIDGMNPAFIFTPDTKFAISPIRNAQVIEKMNQLKKAAENNSAQAA